MFDSNPLVNKQALFKEQLRELLNKYSLDSRIGIPDYILSESVIHHLVGLHQMQLASKPHKAETPTVVDAPSIPTHYLVMAPDQRTAIEWAYQNEIGSTQWTLITGVGTVEAVKRQKKEREERGMPPRVFKPVQLNPEKWSLALQQIASHNDWLSLIS